MKNYVYLLSILLTSTTTSIHAAENCAKLSSISGSNCDDLKVTLDLSKCDEALVGKEKVTNCSDKNATLQFKSDSAQYVLSLKKGDGVWSDAKWQIDGSITRKEIQPEELLAEVKKEKKSKEKKKKIEKKEILKHSESSDELKNHPKEIENEKKYEPLVLSPAAVEIKKPILSLTPPIPQIETPLFSPYGFILTNITVSNHGVDSYGNPNQSAPTAATPNVASVTSGTTTYTNTPAAQNQQLRSSFQAAQSRIGVVINPAKKVRGKLEFDFIDFTKATPTTQMYPRIRIAKVEYYTENKTTYILGQDWDFFSPLNPVNYNAVGSYFQAGNAGFLRQQLGVVDSYDWGEFAIALGLPTANSGNFDTNVEISKAPTASTRLKFNAGKSSFGMSAVIGKVIFNTSVTNERKVYGLNLFADIVTNEFIIKFETYCGQNLSNIGALTIAQGRETASVKECGGYLTPKFILSPSVSFYTGVGYASIPNKASVSNRSNTITSSLVGSLGTATTGIRNNLLLKVGFDKKMTEKLNAFFEVSRFRTSYNISSAVQTANAMTYSLGMQMPF